MTVKEFESTLESYREPPSSNPHGDYTTHCYLVHKLDGQTHYFEVREWNNSANSGLTVFIVNWTLCAGSGTIYINEDNVDNFRITKTCEILHN